MASAMMRLIMKIADLMVVTVVVLVPTTTIALIAHVMQHPH